MVSNDAGPFIDPAMLVGLARRPLMLLGDPARDPVSEPLVSERAWPWCPRDSGTLNALVNGLSGFTQV